MTHKAIFMDRDDTLIEDPGYINHPSQVRLLPGAAAALCQLKKMGYLLIVVSNQSGVARGIVSEETLEQIHHRLHKLLADEGAYLDAIYYCPYHPEGVIAKYRTESDLRKPNPGMLLKAAEEHNIDLSQSWMIGDSYRDIAAGRRAGCRTILIDSPIKRPERGPSDPLPDRKVGSLREAANVIRMIHQQEQQQQPPPQKQQEVPSRPQPATEETTSPQPVEKPHGPQPFTSAPTQEKQQVSQTASPPPDVKDSSSQTAYTRFAASESEYPHTMLREILHLIRSRHRQELYEEFSFFRLVAMITEIISLFCLIVSVWFWFDSTRPITSAQMMLGYALVLQLVTIALLLVKKDR